MSLLHSIKPPKMGSEWLWKGVGVNPSSVPIFGGHHWIRYLALIGEEGRNDLVKAAHLALKVHLKDTLTEEALHPFPPQYARPGHLPLRILYVAHLIDGSIRVLGMRTGSKGEKPWDLAEVVAKAVSRHLGHKLNIAECKIWGKDEVNETTGRLEFRRYTGEETILCL